MLFEAKKGALLPDKLFVLAACISMTLIGPLEAGRKPRADVITLMQFSDLHGKMIPHQEIFPGGRAAANSGGLAKAATVIKRIRDENPNSLLLNVGDTTHGTAEANFTLGEALMPGVNALGIDVMVPGNWDFGYGPAVFRNRFAGENLPLSPNNRTTLSSTKEGCEASAPTCSITRANFDTVAVNLYNYNEATGEMGGRVLPPYVIKKVGELNVAVIGLTADMVPQQAEAFNIGLRFTMGYEDHELPAMIKEVRSQGVDLVVVISELGLPKDIQIAREIPGIDVMFSGHTHEQTLEPIVIRHPNDRITLVTEAGEDQFVGRLDLRVGREGVAAYLWNLIELDESIPEDPQMKAIVDESRKTFVTGPDFRCHTFGPGGFPYGEGHTLCDPLDTVVGKTMVTLERWDVLEDESNNLMTTAFLDAALSSVPGATMDNTLSITNGFRFDTVILGEGTPLQGGGVASGDITLGDLYAYYPNGASLAVTEFTGGRLRAAWEGILDIVFHPQPYLQRGGWFLGFSQNMHFDIDLMKGPLSASQGRILDVSINGNKLDDSKVYNVFSCYPHGNPSDEVCRTNGARNLRFLAGVKNPDGTVSPPYSLVEPMNQEAILDPLRRPVILQVAPNNFVHPINIVRNFLEENVVTGHMVQTGRVTAVGGKPVSTYAENFVQPVQGAGPRWMGRELIYSNDQQ